jgi:hypothetical protein
VSLQRLDVTVQWRTPPEPAASVIAAARRAIDAFAADPAQQRIGALVHSHFELAWHALQHLVERRLAPGRRFCEWGSGFGVVSCLAAQLGFDACGIEIEDRLVAAAQRLAGEVALPVRFECVDYRTPGYVPPAADVVYAYPWPAEERHIFALFERCAAPGALLLSYHGGKQLSLHRQGG